MLNQSRGKKEMFHKVNNSESRFDPDVVFVRCQRTGNYFLCVHSLERAHRIVTVISPLLYPSFIALNRDISTDASSYYSPKSAFRKQYIYTAVSIWKEIPSTVTTRRFRSAFRFFTSLLGARLGMIPCLSFDISIASPSMRSAMSSNNSQS